MQSANILLFCSKEQLQQTKRFESNSLCIPLYHFLTEIAISKNRNLSQIYRQKIGIITYFFAFLFYKIIKSVRKIGFIVQKDHAHKKGQTKERSVLQKEERQF
jgi:hypothetical protein